MFVSLLFFAAEWYISAEILVLKSIAFEQNVVCDAVIVVFGLETCNCNLYFTNKSLSDTEKVNEHSLHNMI